MVEGKALADVNKTRVAVSALPSAASAGAGALGAELGLEGLYLGGFVLMNDIMVQGSVSIGLKAMQGERIDPSSMYGQAAVSNLMTFGIGYFANPLMRGASFAVTKSAELASRAISRIGFTAAGILARTYLQTLRLTGVIKNYKLISRLELYEEVLKSVPDANRARQVVEAFYGPVFKVEVAAGSKWVRFAGAKEVVKGGVPGRWHAPLLFAYLVGPVRTTGRIAFQTLPSWSKMDYWVRHKVIKDTDAYFGIVATQGVGKMISPFSPFPQIFFPGETKKFLAPAFRKPTPVLGPDVISEIQKLLLELLLGK